MVGAAIGLRSLVSSGEADASAVDDGVSENDVAGSSKISVDRCKGRPSSSKLAV